jgi:hypothetical protein
MRKDSLGCAGAGTRIRFEITCTPARRQDMDQNKFVFRLMPVVNINTSASDPPSSTVLNKVTALILASRSSRR